MNDNSNLILDIRDLSKFYGDRKAVDSISMQLYAGKIYGFIGPNGAGKSTTIKMITGLARPSTGDIFICNNSITYKYEEAVKNMGAIIETPDMYTYLSGLDNLKFYASLYKNKISTQQINNVVKLVGLENRIKEKVKNYSLGMKQRLGIAQALINSPKLIILDEPTNGLDVNGIIEMRKLLKNLAHKSGVTIMVSSHILSEMEQLCDEIHIINNGKIVKVKNSAEIKEANLSKIFFYVQTNYLNYTGKLLRDELKLKNVKLSGDKTKVLFNCESKQIPEIVNFLIAKKLNIFAIGKLEQTLEDEFLDIVNSNSKSTSIK